MDFLLYLTEMRAGFEGKWLSVDPFTTEEHSPLFYHPFYLSLGHLSRIAGPLLKNLPHRPVCVRLLFMAASIYCTRSLVRSLRVRRYAHLLTFFAGGIGHIVPFAVRVWPGTTSPFVLPTSHTLCWRTAFRVRGNPLFFVRKRDAMSPHGIAGMCVALLNIVLPYYSLLLIALAGVLAVERMLSLPSERKNRASCVSLPRDLCHLFIVMALIGLSDHPLAISQHGVLRAYSIPELRRALEDYGFFYHWISIAPAA